MAGYGRSLREDPRGSGQNRDRGSDDLLGNGNHFYNLIKPAAVCHTSRTSDTFFQMLIQNFTVN